MAKRLTIITVLFLLIGLAVFRVSPANASPNGDCSAFATGTGMIPLTSFDFSFTCAADADIVYFGTCDSGAVPDDDLFTIVYGGNVVSYNEYINSVEYVYAGSASAPAGINTATLNSINTGVADATWSYAVSTDFSEVSNYMNSECGADLGDVLPPSSVSGCSTGSVPVFTTDKAPGEGTLEFHVLLGNEGAREDEQIIKIWDVSKDQQINNLMVTNLAAPRYARVWWQPDGSSEWYMLSSQYWSAGSWSTDQEYGISCGGGQPSYHTSFASAIVESDVCFDLENGCN